MLNKVMKAVKAPGAEFRSAPFWSWNSEMEPEEIRRQVDLFHEMGIGGFFIHPRVGLKTPYLGGKYFDCVRAAVDEAKGLEMKPWLYDEDRWPSGAAGGLVTRNRKYAHRILAHEEITPAYTDADAKEKEECTLAYFAETLGENQLLRACRRVKSPKQANLKPGETLVRYYRQLTKKLSWFNNESYLDMMDPDACAKFIEVTHEAYKREVGGEFGKNIPGIFTDEPNYHFSYNQKNTSPWTDTLPAKFQKKYGYDLLDFLPEVCHTIEGRSFSRARLHYYDLCTDLFVHSFFKQIFDWCAKNDLQFTGHVLEEDYLSSQTACVGSAMRAYEYMQAPGIDLLTENWNIFGTAKQCTSMAHQFGRRWRLSETYGCTGWDFPFIGHKALGDWQYALGINFRCPHLAWYSMAAQAKRDYPASISYQSPWYRYLPVVEDYFGRLGAALSEGEEQRDLLVIHPIESQWGVQPACERAYWTDKTDRSDDLLNLRNTLLSAKLDFDYGEEEVMSRNGKVHAKKQTISVAKASYKAVLVPELLTIRKTTLKLLQAFRKAGGLVVYEGKAPAYVDGVESGDAKNAFREFKKATRATLEKVLAPTARRVSVAGGDGKQIEPVLTILRKANDHETLFLCNIGMPVMFQNQMGVPDVIKRKLKFDQVQISVKSSAAHVFELDLNSGTVYRVNAVRRKDSISFATSFPEIGSRLFFLTDKEMPEAKAPRATTVSLHARKLKAKEIPFACDESNVFVLDQAVYSVNGGKFSKNDYILNIDRTLRQEYLNAPKRGGEMAQPWLDASVKTPDKTLDLALKYTFECTVKPVEDCFLGIEEPGLYKIELNGTAISQKDCGYWCDRSMRLLKLPASAFRKGVNTLTMTSVFHRYLAGLEAAFILGHFGVSENAIGAYPETLKIGDVCKQGLANYSGNLTYQFEFNFNPKNDDFTGIEVEKFNGVALGFRINGEDLKLVAWPPYRLEIRDMLKPGKNTLEIMVVGSRRNSHGPFYLDAKPSWCGSGQLEAFNHPEKGLVEFGLLSAPVLN